MKPNLRITYRHLPPSEALSAFIEAEAHELERHCGQLLDCHVTVEPPHGTPAHVKRCRVHVDASLPGKTVVANREPSTHEGHDDPYLAVREAFRIARHELERFTQRRAERRQLPRSGQKG